MSARRKHAAAILRAVPIALILATAPGQASPSGASRHAIPGADVAIYNLVGSIEMVRGQGTEIVAEVTPGGKDAGRLEVAKGEIRGRQTLRVIYPSDHILVPELGGHTTSTTWVREDGSFDDDAHGGRKVILSGKGSGLEAHADVRLLIPPGKKVSVYWVHGKGTLSGVDGRISLEAGGMPVTASGLAGSFHLEVGSGDVQVTDSEGEISIETGSGGVTLEGIHGRQLSVDTGSGEVSGRRLDTETISIDTGSGEIDMSGIGADQATFDTGSGNITLALERDIQALSLDSGSGDIVVGVPRNLGAKLNVETASGEVETDLDIQTSHRKRNELRGILGDGKGLIEIESGSGTVSIRSGAR